MVRNLVSVHVNAYQTIANRQEKKRLSLNEASSFVSNHDFKNNSFVTDDLSGVPSKIIFSPTKEEYFFISIFFRIQIIESNLEIHFLENLAGQVLWP